MKKTDYDNFSPAAQRKLDAIKNRTPEERLANKIYWKGSDILYEDNYRLTQPRKLRPIAELVKEVTTLKLAGRSDDEIEKNVSALKYK